MTRVSDVLGQKLECTIDYLLSLFDGKDRLQCELHETST